MPERRVVRSLGLQSPRRWGIFEYEEGELPDGHFRVDTLYSGLSAGTELTFFKGTNPYLQATWDAEYGVFVKGVPAQEFPMPFIGYMESARVVESRSESVEPGTIVGMAYGHKTGHTAGADEFFLPAPPDIDPILAIYLAQMGPICANGILHAAAEKPGKEVMSLGDGVHGKNILVMGGGVVGLLTGLFALHYGAANVALADPTPQRLDAAGQLGMIPVDLNRVEAWRFCKENWRDGQERGADLVLQCRARSASLNDALRSLRPQGTVVDLAFYQGGANDLFLGEEFHHNGLSIRCAQIGRVPRGLAPSWNKARLAQETCELLRARGRAIRENIITDVVPLEEAPEFIEALADHRAHAIQAVLQLN